MPMGNPAAVFDALAPEYDRTFGGTLGPVYRRAVWRWTDSAFRPGQRILELNCGTGEDALHLARRGVRVLATDASAGMLDVAREKVSAAGLAGAVEVRELAIEQLDGLAREFGGQFDGGLSNFGGLNFVADLPPVSRALAALLRPGARLVLCLVGPLVPWEWAWFIGQGQPRKAFRRLSPGGVLWKGVRVRYPSPHRIRRAFEREFRAVRTGGLGVLLPPPYTEGWASRHPRLIALLDRWERRLEGAPLAAWLGDHCLIELERR